MTKLQYLIIQCFRLNIQKTNKTQPQVYLIWNLLQIYNAFALLSFYKEIGMILENPKMCMPKRIGFITHDKKFSSAKIEIIHKTANVHKKKL